MIISLLVLAAVCMLMATVQIVKENRKAKARRAIKQSREYSCVPWDADEYLKAFLEENKSRYKEFKLAALVVEDIEGHKYIEDIDLRGDSAEPVSLSSFAIKKRTKDKADAFLFNRWIIETIANKVNCLVDSNVERYYAFQLTKENVLAGRHGKQKKKIQSDYVMMMDLDELDLKRIANLSI
jgi:hypothetical protein